MITGGAVTACAAWRILSTPLGAAMTAGGHKVLRCAGHPGLKTPMQPVDPCGLLLHANSEWGVAVWEGHIYIQVGEPGLLV